MPHSTLLSLIYLPCERSPLIHNKMDPNKLASNNIVCHWYHHETYQNLGDFAWKTAWPQIWWGGKAAHEGPEDKVGVKDDEMDVDDEEEGNILDKDSKMSYCGSFWLMHLYSHPFFSQAQKLWVNKVTIWL
jgi:hypothetical protein